MNKNKDIFRWYAMIASFNLAIDIKITSQIHIFYNTNATSFQLRMQKNVEQFCYDMHLHALWKIIFNLTMSILGTR